MRFLFILCILTTACSFNNDSRYWSEDNIKRVNNEIKLKKIIRKSDDIFSMTFNEYKIFLEDYTKNTKYPKISNQ
tara:strand:- start:79 stop:303 length:225 start_codon:yes stop_codon:yes gene_type:complete